MLASNGEQSVTKGYHAMVRPLNIHEKIQRLGDALGEVKKFIFGIPGTSTNNVLALEVSQM